MRENVQLPKSPFHDRNDTEKEFLSDEIRAVVGIFEFTRRLRAKVPPADVDKPRENVTESAGDHTAMTAYLMHYFLPLVERGAERLKYKKTLDMVLAHDIGDIGKLPLRPGVQQTLEQRREEIINTAKVFEDLPRRNGFNRSLSDAYAEYLGQDTREARFVRALNGLETMLYVLSRPPHLRAQLIGGKGYAIEDYRERIEPFCREFPPIYQFYTRIERILHSKGYFAPSREYENRAMRPEVARNLFISNAPDFGDPKNLDIDSENERLLTLQRLKRRLRFGQPPKPETEHSDTVPEHISSLLFLARYFFPAIQADKRQMQKRTLSLRGINARVLTHDTPEIIWGDVIAPLKTEKHSVEEWDAAVEIASDLAPRAGKFNKKFWKYFEKYELDRDPDKLPFAGNSWFVKALDVLEAQLYIFDRETRGKLPRMQVVPRAEIRKRHGKVIDLFPVLKNHFDALERKFNEEKLP